ncbi:hypothetical protein CEXT_646721 [Caerostris extrusa]|uniref:Uncharacterized protein n=1 Tax=Caerostris extrusa TaxID=172846 RepID=A0AAV4QZ27_CAEEX|nr:hypothetical protein CEXT_646721 [Caerostris extrusa]
MSQNKMANMNFFSKKKTRPIKKQCQSSQRTGICYRSKGLRIPQLVHIKYNMTSVSQKETNNEMVENKLEYFSEKLCFAFHNWIM